VYEIEGRELCETRGFGFRYYNFMAGAPDHCAEGIALLLRPHRGVKDTGFRQWEGCVSYFLASRLKFRRRILASSKSCVSEPSVN
jgi:hypothetical protein